MSAPAARFTGDMPTHYDSGLGPVLFVDYAQDLARRAASRKPLRVLEIAAGTGIATQMLRDALPASSDLVATDLNPAMLAIARRKFAAGQRIEFLPADAAALPFADGDFDALVCQFGVMFFPDKDQAYREAYRVLARAGRYHFSVWDSFEFNPFARIAHETVGTFFHDKAPDFFTVPFGYHCIDTIKASLIRAGFADISAHVLRIATTVAHARRLADGLIRGNPIVDEIDARGAPGSAVIVDAVTAALQREFAQGSGHMPLQAIVFEACKQ